MNKHNPPITDIEIKQLLTETVSKYNDAIDQLMIRRQASQNGSKQRLSYITKKFDLITKCCNLALDKLEEAK